MTSAYHCGNCPNKGTEKCPYDVRCYNEDGCDYIQPFKRTEEFKNFVDLCGLLCHPLAQAALREEGAKQECARIVEILENYKLGLDYPDCPPGDTITTLIKSLRQSQSTRGQQHTGDMSDLELVEGRLEGLKILLNTPVNKKTMTDAELKYAIYEIEIIRDCMKITAGQQHEGGQR